MRIRILLVQIMMLCLCAQTSAKIIVVDQISLPIKSYCDKNGSRTVLSPFGEMLVELRYADTFNSANNNSYSIHFRGYSDNSRKIEFLIFTGGLEGRSQHEVDRGSWGKTTWAERRNWQGIKHFIEFSNGFWATRCAIVDDEIIMTHGRLSEDGSLKRYTSIVQIEGGEDSWNKLVKFLRNAHNHNIGRAI